MSFRFPQPSNEDDFELFCLRLVRELWQCSSFQQYGKRGERQNGIDLIDEAGGPPFRAVQCKHHESDKTIPPAEVQDEVTLALASGLDLDEYYVLTSARKTVHTQNALIKINRDHVAIGRFKVFLWTWDEIERRLSELDDVTQDRVLRGDSGRGGPALSKMLTGVMAEHFDRPIYAAASALDTELDAVKAAIDRHEHEVAAAKIRDLETRASDKLQPHHWYNLKALRSRIYSARCQWERAGRELLDAKRHTPQTDRAKINEALGLELTGDREGAHTLATELRSELTQSVRLMCIWARTAPSSATLESLAAVVGPFAKDDEEINLALGQRAIASGQFTDAIPYARRATEIDANSPHAWFLFGQAKHAAGFSALTGVQSALLREALEHYDRAVTLAQTQNLTGLEAAIRFNRGKVRHLLGDGRAEADYLAAIERETPDQGLRTEYAGFLLEMGRPADALRELEGARREPGEPHLFYEAAARYGRNQGDDRARASALLRQIIAAEPTDRWVDAHVLLVQWAVEGKTQASAKAAITESRLREVDPFIYHVLSGWLADSDGKTDTAKAEYDSALKALTAETQRDHVFLLAQALVAVHEDEKALPLLESSYRPGVFNLECRKLLACAQRLERHNVAARVCRELREAGESDPRIVQTEIGIRQLYEPHAALALAQEYLNRHLDDRHVALWQSMLAARLDRPELVISDLNRLPTADDVTPEGGGAVINILTDAGQHSAALRYAYELLRSHYGEEFAHGQYIAHFLDLSPRCPELEVGGVAQLGMAVCYREEREEIDRWVVLEESSEVNLSLHELAPDHALSQALVGKKVGDVVTVPGAGIQPRSLTIREACHKFVRRFQDCLNQYQVLFPGGTAIQMVHVGSGDEFDPSPIVEGLEANRRRVEEIDGHYRTGRMPFHLYAELTCNDEFTAWTHLISKPDLGIHCFDGQADGLRAGMELARGSKRIVCDITALITLAQLKLLSVLQSKKRVFVVAQSTYERLQYYVEVAGFERNSPGSVCLTDDGKLAGVEVTPEQRDRYRLFLEGICEAVRQSCQIESCPQAAELEPKRRADIIRAIGRHNLDSLLLASASDSVLWTDDLVLGMVGKAECKVQRVWTQAVLLTLRRDSELASAEFDRAVAKLVGWHYRGMQFDEEALVAAAEIAEWRMNCWPVPALMHCLASSGVDVLTRLRVAAHAIRAVWRRDLSSSSRTVFLHATLDALQNPAIVRRLLQAIPKLFGVDVLSADEVQLHIAAWLRAPTVKLIVP